jgi:hypothetical protein
MISMGTALRVLADELIELCEEETEAQAEADARLHIQGRDPIAEKLEFSK